MKKNDCISWEWKVPGLQKVFRIMKLTVFLLLLSVISVFASKSYSQTQVLNLDMKNSTVKEVLRNIEKQSEFVFMYSEKLIDVNREVSVNMRNQKINEVLDELFAGTNVKYKIKDRFILLTTPEVLSSDLMAQQQKSVSGKVTEPGGQPLPGVTVVAKGTTQGTVTNADGNYSLTNIPDDATLVFSFVGMRTREVVVGNQTTIDVVMEEEMIGLEEVVAIGYGTQRREVVTSAITSVKEKDFTQGFVKDPMRLLQGKVAGLALSTPSGDPVGGTQINIRGVSTLASSSDPLVVIDGIPGANLDAIAPEDIESIDILKDGSAAAIYGSRATGGVVIVTTKRNTGRGGASIDYNSYLSIDQIERKIDVFSAQEYTNLPQTTGLNNLSIEDYGSSTNWQDEILRSPVNMVQNLSVRGGDDKSNFIASITYRTQEGIMLNSDKNSLIGRLDINHSALNDRVRFNFNMSNNMTNSKGVWYDAYLNAITRNPTLAVYDENGQFTEFSGMVLNPVALLVTETDYNRWNQLLTSASVTFEPIKDWNINVMGALQRYDNQSDKSNDFRSQRTTINRLNGEVWKNNNQSVEQTLEVTSDYKVSVNDDHHFNFLAGYSYQDFLYQHNDAYAYDFPTDRFGPWNIGIANSIVEGKATMGSYKSTSKLAAFFGRVNYNYNAKYLFMFSIRREGSSKFGENHKWGWFPGVNAGWRISNEPFMEGAAFVNQLKLRIGYGVTGTQPADPYLSIPLLSYGQRMYYNGSWIKGVQPSRNPNPDLRWERKEEVNLGLDYSLFNNKLSGSIDLYRRETKDLLYTYNVPVPPNLFNTILANVGNIRNSGVEFTLNSTLKKTSKINWTAGGTFSYNSNILTRFSNNKYELDFLNIGYAGFPIQTYSHRISEGEPIGNFYGYKSVGINEDGNWLVLDKDENEILVDDAGEGDRYVLGNGLPKMYASLFTSLNYGGFDFSLTLRGAFDFQVFNQYRMLFESFGRLGSGNVPKTVLDKPLGSDYYIQTAPKYVSYYIEDGDFIKIDNVTLGYSFTIKNTKIVKKARIYVSGLNLYTFTKYKGLDPEVSIKGLDPGMDFMAKYPSIRTMTLGINVSF